MRRIAVLMKTTENFATSACCFHSELSVVGVISEYSLNIWTTKASILLYQTVMCSSWIRCHSQILIPHFAINGMLHWLPAFEFPGWNLRTNQSKTPSRSLPRDFWTRSSWRICYGDGDQSGSESASDWLYRRHFDVKHYALSQRVDSGWNMSATILW